MNARYYVPNGAVPDPLVTLTINGITIRIFIDGNGKPYAQTDDSKGNDIVKGLNAGFDWLWKQDKNFFKSMTSKNWKNFGTKIQDFYKNNYIESSEKPISFALILLILAFLFQIIYYFL